MRVGRAASLLISVAAAGAATGVAWVFVATPWFAALSEPLRLLAFGGAVLAVCAIIILPLGISVDGVLARLSSYVNSTVTSGEEPTPFRTARWIAPVSRIFQAAATQAWKRERDLRDRLRNLELHHRVTETERRQLENVLDALRDAVLVTDAFDEITTLNETAAGVLALDRVEAVHKHLTKMIQDDRLSQVIREVRESANFSDRRQVELDLPVDGRRAAFEVSVSCIKSLSDDVGGVVTILHDLTREREISQMKSDFVSKASHELRTPLSSIRAYVEMLVDGEATDESARKEFYGVIQKETERLSRLIDNMLNISRIEAGIVQIEREQVDIRELMSRAVETIEPQAKAKDMSIISKAPPVDLTVEGDTDMLYQVILNLASNAVKYTPEGGRVIISADSDNLTQSVVVSVSDTGLGIPPDAIPKLFEKFYRVENFKRVAKGTGLGLNLCKHIVETVHHGQIGVESQLGMGSKFWFSVPMRYIGSQAAA